MAHAAMEFCPLHTFRGSKVISLLSKKGLFSILASVKWQPSLKIPDPVPSIPWIDLREVMQGLLLAPIRTGRRSIHQRGESCSTLSLILPSSRKFEAEDCEQNSAVVLLISPPLDYFSTTIASRYGADQATALSPTRIVLYLHVTDMYPPAETPLSASKSRSSISAEQWSRRKDLIRKLHLEEGKPLKEVMELLKVQSNFEPT